MIHLILGGALIAYGLVVKSKGEEIMKESMPWFLIVGIGVMFIFIGMN